MKKELRLISGPVEVRDATEEAPVTISGYAIRFNSETTIGGCFREVVRPSAIPDDIQTHDVRALWNHNSDFPIGRTTNGSLTFEKDVNGLRFDLVPSNTSWGKDAVEAIRRGDVSGMSFGFFTDDDRWSDQGKPLPLRELLGVDLLEVSPVTFPAYPSTSVGARSAEEILAEMPLPPDGVNIDAEARQREIEIYEREAKI